MDGNYENNILASGGIYHSLFRSMNEGFLLAEMVYDEQGRPVDFIILDANPACEKQAGLDRKTLLAKRGSELLEKVEPKWFAPFSQVSAGRVVRFDEYIAATERWFEVDAYRLQDGNQFAMILTDITERKRTEEKIHRQNAVVEGINRILGVALTCDTEEELGRTCLAVVLELTQSKFGFIGEINSDGNMDDIAISDPSWGGFRLKEQTDYQDTPKGLRVRGIFGQILQGKPLITNNPAAHPASVGLPKGHPTLTAFLGAPLFNENRIIGMIGLGNREGSYLPEHLEVVETLAHAIVQVLKHYRDINERKRAEEALQARQEELAAANEELRAQQEELTAINEELLAQTEELNITYRELQSRTEEIREHAEAAERQREAAGRAREEAERRAAELDATISSIANGVIIYDLTGKIIRMNQFARMMFNYSGADHQRPSHLGPEKIEMYKPDGTLYSIGATPLERALRGEIIRDEEVFIIQRDSRRPIWLASTFAPIQDSNNNSLGVVFTFTDITERKRKAAEILASEREMLQVTLNSLGEGVAACDQQGRIIFMNEAAANLTGYSQVEALGEPVAEILHIHNDTSSPSGEPFPKILHIYDDAGSPDGEPGGKPDGLPRTGAASFKEFYNPILITRDSNEIPIDFNHSPIKTPDGLIIGAVTVFQDISEKRKIEQELLRAGKLESLGILAGGIAHDFNNVLAAILSNVQLAMIKFKKNEDIEAYLANTVETTRKASELTKQLLTFSKGGAPVKKDASLNELIRDTAEFVLRGAKSKAEFAIPNDLWTARIDVGQISQVIHNLVLNAEQAMPRGGIIRIRAENVTLEENHQVAPGQYVKITVSDQGVGIAEENLVKIFDPYFTTKKDGNGLGLATSYSIITRHNGYIDVESREGAGASFFIYLPASNTVEPPVEAQPEVIASGGAFKILLMDDEKQILNAVREMLQCKGHQVLTTTDGAQAIEVYRRAKESGIPFDVVIMDLTIPGGMGGQEVIAYLREFDPRIKAIVSSGYANDPIMADFERYGFCGVVSKPYKIDELNEVLYRAIGRK